jgi:energy-coupling factor transporter ATP-binding protein EcfA2
MIELSGVSFSYPDGTKALSEINLVIDEGEFVVVCGPTGCGKSTLLMTVNGLIPHTVSGEYQGEARVAGRVVRDVSVAGLAAHVGTVFQNPEAQIFSLTCEDEIAFGLENLSLSPWEIDKRIDNVLHLLSLDSLRRRRTAELSGGEKQKLVIAATLAMGPRVLVLDEPLSDLDPEGKITVLNTIARLNQEGMTIVMAEHNLDLVLQDATRMLVMEKGRVVFDGDPCSILARGQDQGPLLCCCYFHPGLSLYSSDPAKPISTDGCTKAEGYRTLQPKRGCRLIECPAGHYPSHC